MLKKTILKKLWELQEQKNLTRQKGGKPLKKKELQAINQVDDEKKNPVKERVTIKKAVWALVTMSYS